MIIHTETGAVTIARFEWGWAAFRDGKRLCDPHKTRAACRNFVLRNFSAAQSVGA